MTSRTWPSYTAKLEMIAVVFDIDKETTSDDPFEGNDYVAEVMNSTPTCSSAGPASIPGRAGPP